ncbi:MAG: hypothetical protein IKH30_03160 [Clostridia bacterium]|nr:hypothetical protein [Clostridia bacterium]
MNEAHWMLLGLTAALTAALVIISLSARPQSRLYCWTRRVFWAAALLILSGEIGGVGLNVFTLAAVIGLGFPGYAAVSALSFF